MSPCRRETYAPLHTPFRYSLQAYQTSHLWAIRKTLKVAQENPELSFFGERLDSFPLLWHSILREVLDAAQVDP